MQSSASALGGHVGALGRLLVVSVFVQAAVSEIIDSLGRIGYVYEDGEVVSTVYCDGARFANAAEFNMPDMLYCSKTAESYKSLGTRCLGTNAGKSDLGKTGEMWHTASHTCQRQYPCMTVTVYKAWHTQSSSLLIDCMDSLGLSQPVSTLYMSYPEPPLTTAATAPRTTTTGVAETASVADSANNGGSQDVAQDDAREKTGSSSSNKTGVIAGAVVGGVGGLALLIGALWFGMRLGKKKAKKAAKSQEERGEKDVSGTEGKPSGPVMAELSSGTTTRPTELDTETMTMTATPELETTAKATPELDSTAKTTNAAELESTAKSTAAVATELAAAQEGMKPVVYHEMDGSTVTRQ